MNLFLIGPVRSAIPTLRAFQLAIDLVPSLCVSSKILIPDAALCAEIALYNFRHCLRHWQCSNQEDDMSRKVAFSRSDVIAINSRMSMQAAEVRAAAMSAAALAHRVPGISAYAPASPVAAKIMREVGVSSEKLSEAYGVARTVVGNYK